MRQAQLIARRGLVALCAVLAAVAPSGVGHGTASAAWLHTDGRIVFVSDLDRVASDLYTMKPDGTDIRRITFDALPASPLQSLQYFDPAFSPDGTKIAAARDNAVTADLLVMNADGSNPVVIGPRGNSPSWSPDGTQLVFSQFRIADSIHYQNIQRINANGTSQVAITTTDTQDTDPAWSPDGTKIAFIRNDHLAIMNANGSSVVQPQPTINYAAAPEWSPDGTKIAFHGQFGFYIANADGTSAKLIMSDRMDSAMGFAAWAPDGQRIIVNHGTALWMIKPDGSCGVPVLQPAYPNSSWTADWQPTATPSGYSMPTAACVTVKRGVNAVIPVTINRNGNTSPISLSVSGLPTGTTATFSPNPATGSTSTLTITSTECPTPTPAGDYPLTITGNGGGTIRTTIAGARFTDGAPRITKAPTSAFAANTTVTSNSMPVKTTWAGCDSEYIDQFKLERYKTSWSQQSIPVLATSVTQWLPWSTSYRYRVSAVDHNLQWTTPPSYGPTIQPRLVQQSSSYVHYGGTWSTSSSTVYLGGSNKRATAAGAWVSYTFTGQSVAWIGAVGPTRGSAKVYIDGVLKATVSTYAATTVYRRVLYAYNWSSQAVHTIKVVVVGTSGHARVDVDAFARLYRP